MACSFDYIHLSDCPQQGKRAIAIGNFDGVHKGHQELIKRVCAYAREQGLESSVLTFDPHPQEFLHPGNGPKMIMSLAEKIEFLGNMGIDSVIVQAFNQEFCDLPPLEFARYVHDVFHAAHVVVGFNYTFGKYGAGKAEDLRAFGNNFGFTVDVIPEQTFDNATISSTRIREALSSSEDTLAEALLGHTLSLA